MREDAPTGIDEPVADGDEKQGPDADAFSTPPFLVAAVGASAGGLEAFSRLVRRMPIDAPLALVLVQHLARDQQSLLPEILARRTAMTVCEARDEMQIEVGHAYVIPAGAHMTVIDGHLRVRPRPAGPSGSQVNVLFRSLAEYYREKAVGVVLSGGATDGAVGLREIKAVGGITIAQQPEDAQIDSMPRAAIAAGAVDVVLPVDGIGDELLRLAALPQYAVQRNEGVAEPVEMEDVYLAIFRLLRRTAGIDLTNYKRPTIVRRIARRMALRRVQDLPAYLDLLTNSSTELNSLQEDVLIHVTSFFREPESFTALTRSVLPLLLRKRGDSPLRIWVPGCATGEEVYSLAISLFEALADEAELVPIQIFGTDVSKISVERARAGVYAEAIAAEVSPERLRRFFSKLDGHYQICKAIRERCVFARQDLTRDPPFSRLDLAMCRNTLIYLGQPIQRRIIAMMHYALKPHGILVLGRAETTGSNAGLFTIVDKRFKIYQKQPSASPPEFDFRATPFEAQIAGPVPAATLAPVPRRAPRPWDVQAEANRFLLERYSPPGIVVDASFQIVSTHGATAPFLELPTGAPSFDALKMVRPEFLSPLRSGLEEARESQDVIRKNAIAPGSDVTQTVDIEVAPLGSPEAPHFLVSFESVRTQTGVSERPATPSVGGPSSDPVSVRLRRELAHTREQLHANIHDLAAANEELQSANEEILSSNEELQSTNEELDTAKEELQSTNEELSTVNEELHGRNEELSSTNSDLANLLASVQIPIVMIASDFTIRRFTPAGQRLLNLIPSDVGRPIRHIKPNIPSWDIEKPVTEVMDTMAPYEREVEDDGGRTYLLQIRPYKSLENRVDGAVLALFDISTTKEALLVAKRTADAVVAKVQDAILLLDSELRVTGVNPSFCAAFDLKPEEAKGAYIYELADGQWDAPELRSLLEEVLPSKQNFDDFIIERDFPRIGKRRLRLAGQRIESGDVERDIILLVVHLEARRVD